jgi:hypothetical protein
MRDFKLIDNTGDIDLTNGDLQIADGLACIAQIIGTRFRFQRGDWFLDRRVGAPIFDDGSGVAMIGANRGELETVRAIATQILADTPGVRRVVSLTFDLDSNRALTVEWQVEADNGEIIAGVENLIFEDSI